MSDWRSIWPDEETVTLEMPFTIAVIRDLSTMNRRRTDDLPASLAELEARLAPLRSVMLRIEQRPDEGVYHVLADRLRLTCGLYTLHGGRPSDSLQVVGLSVATDADRRRFLERSLKVNVSAGWEVADQSPPSGWAIGRIRRFQRFLAEVQGRWERLGTAPKEEVASKARSPEFLHWLAVLRSYVHMEHQLESMDLQKMGDIPYLNIWNLWPAHG
ncbi:MAG: hypothetical protein OWV35_04550 [Firmicutes bacterium]|nr:hypothetical protein [Bacillota bacterium]